MGEASGVDSKYATNITDKNMGQIRRTELRNVRLPCGGVHVTPILNPTAIKPPLQHCPEVGIDEHIRLGNGGALVVSEGTDRVSTVVRVGRALSPKALVTVLVVKHLGAVKQE